MKRIILLSVLLSVVITVGLHAQSFGVGGRIGFNTSTILVDNDVQQEISFVIGGNIEAYAYKMFNKRAGIEGGLMFTQAGYSLDYSDETNRLAYFAIPISARFKWGYFTLNPGIRPAFVIKAETTWGKVPNTDVGIFVSPGLQFPNGITLNGNFCFGLSDLYNSFNNSSNLVMQLTVGYTLSGTIFWDDVK